MPVLDASYPMGLCQNCGKYPAIRGRPCFVCFTDCAVDSEGYLIKRQPEASALGGQP